MSIEYFDLHRNPEFTFSSCVRAGDFVYTAHHGAWTYGDAPRELSVEEQTARILENLRITWLRRERRWMMRSRPPSG